MICSSENCFRFICPSLLQGRTLAPNGGKNGGHVNLRDPTWFTRRQRIDHLPLNLGQIIAAHLKLPSESLQSNLHRFGNLVYEFTA